MEPRDVKKLLGGYATGTLTPEERDALYAAALNDQKVFNQLAEEHGLKELLDDPDTRQRLLAGLNERPRPAGRPGRLRQWLAGVDLLAPRRRRAVWAAAGGLAVLVLAVTSVTRLYERMRMPPPLAPMESRPEQKQEALRAKDNSSETRAPQSAPRGRLPSGRRDAPAVTGAPSAAPAPVPSKTDAPTPHTRQTVEAAGALAKNILKEIGDYSAGPARQFFYDQAAAPARKAAEPSIGPVGKTPLALRIALTPAVGLSVEATQPSYLYVVAEGAADERQVLVPFVTTPSRLEPHTRVIVPLSTVPAGSRLVVLVSRKAIDALEQATAVVNPAMSLLSERLEPDAAVIERVDEPLPDGGLEHATYLVETRPGRAPFLRLSLPSP